MVMILVRRWSASRRSRTTARSLSALTSIVQLPAAEPVKDGVEDGGRILPCPLLQQARRVVGLPIVFGRGQHGLHRANEVREILSLEDLALPGSLHSLSHCLDVADQDRQPSMGVLQELGTEGD